MAVRAYSPILPSVELFGAYEGIVSAAAINQTTSLTFTPTSEGNLTIVPYDGDSNISELQLEAASSPSSYIPTPEGATATRAAETLTVPAAKLPWPTPKVIGDELVTNGTFDTDTTGWSAVNGTAVVSGGVVEFQQTTVNGLFFSDDITVEAGKEYVFSFTARRGTMTVTKLSVRDQSNGADIIAATPYTVGTSTLEQVSVTFVAPAGCTSIRVYPFRDSGGAIGTAFVDNISVREIDPLAVSIQMEGRMTYADEDAAGGPDPTDGQHVFLAWASDTNNHISVNLTTASTSEGSISFRQRADGTVDFVPSEALTPGILVPYNIASRHGSTFVNGAVDGTALTADTTPVALPDLESTDLSLAYDYMGTVKLFRVWADDLGDTGIEEASA